MKIKIVGITIFLIAFLLYTDQKAADVFDAQPADAFIQLAKNKDYDQMDQLLKTGKIGANAVTTVIGEDGETMLVPLVFKAVQMQDLKMFTMLVYYGANPNMAVESNGSMSNITLEPYLDQKIEENPTVAVYQQMKDALINHFK